MKKLFLLLLPVAMLLFYFGCQNPNEPVTGTHLEKAGTGFEFPNTFDVVGDLCEIGGTYNTQTIGTPMELWMGVGNITAGTLVGYVTFLSNPDRVKIDLTDIDGVPGPDFFPYVAEEVHIHFADDVTGIPHTKKGNPVVGLFDYNIPLDPYESVIEVAVDFKAVGAIHLSVVKYGGVEGFNFYLTDDPVLMKVAYPYAGGPSYFQVFIEGAGFLDGQYDGWCIDLDNVIYQTWYDSHLYSSYEELPPGLVDNPENFDNVNYLVNHFAAGDMVQPMNADCTPVLDGLENPVPEEALTYGDIQNAIWYLLESGRMSNNGAGSWSINRMYAIVCDAINGGDGFVPGCEEKIVFITVPDGGNVQLVIGQPVISSIEVPCETEGGTAWGDGRFGANFPEAKQWGTWFNWDPNCSPAP